MTLRRQPTALSLKPATTRVQRGRISGNRVVATRVERMAAQDAFGGQNRSLECPISLQRLAGVLGTGRIKTASWAQDRRYGELVKPDDSQQKFPNYQDASIFWNSLRREACACLPESSAACRVAIMLISRGPCMSWRFNRKNSRVCRLIRLRVTAVPILFVTVIPRRIRPKGLGRNLTIKYGS